MHDYLHLWNNVDIRIDEYAIPHARNKILQKAKLANVSSQEYPGGLIISGK